MITNGLSNYHQESGMLNEEWDLFGGQHLLTTPDAPAWLSEVGDHVLREGAGSQSPLEEIPQGSIWLDTFDELTSDPLSFSSFQKESHLATDRILARSSSSDEALFLYEESDDSIGDISSTYQPSFDNLPPLASDAHPISLPPTIIPGNLATTFGFPLKWDQTLGKNDEPAPNPYTPERSQHAFDEPFLFQFASDGISQKVPSGTSLELEQFDSGTFNMFDPNDPVSVCKILKLLGDDVDIDPSSMSPEEVDTVLCQEVSRGISTDMEELGLVFSPPSVAESVSEYSFSDSRSLGAISTEYLQNELSLKAGRSPRSTESEPYYGDRKQKKKIQNKNAAQRYREKKREEKGVVKTEVEVLEEKNANLKARADDLTREISYLKALLEEIRNQ